MYARPAFVTSMKRGVAFLRPPFSEDPDQQSRNLVLNALYLGTLGIILMALAVVSVNFFVLKLSYLAPRIAAIALIALIMLALYIQRRRRYLLASYALVAFYFIAATAAIWLWGAQTPIGTLLFALLIITTGTLLGARFALYMLGIAVVVLVALTWLGMSGMVHPDISWARTPAGFYDDAIFAVILGNLALVSWLFNRSMEQSLHRAQKSERALLRQKQHLEEKVEERTRQVQAAHFERVQEMYRFAELGQMSVGLLHDVANYLSVLSLDIEDLKQARQNRSSVARRVQQSIRHLDSLIGQVRSQIKDESSPTSFAIADEINQVIKLLEYKATQQKVSIVVQNSLPRKRLQYVGSLNHFWQVMTNLLSNAIDAYDQHEYSNRKVIIRIEQTDDAITIAVIDHGKGISSTNLERIFEPFYSSKQRGMGIGLAISKRMIEKDFGGHISVISSPKDGTTFMIDLPFHA